MRINKILLVSSIILIVLLSLQQWLIYSNSKDEDIEVSNYKLLQSLNSLENEFDLLKISLDSVQEVIDTNKVKVIEVERKYETIRNHIIIQSMDSDCITFANYISNYKRRLSDSTNSRAIKNY